MTLTLFLVIFLACSVEAVEALTIVLAAGVSHDWRSALTGMGAALGCTVAIVVALAPVLARIPLTPLHLIAGAVMLYYGATWLRKGILRAAGRKALHDEAAIFEAARRVNRSGFALAFNGVFMEGVEIVAIVAAIAAGAPLGYAAAALSVVVVGLVGVAVRAPLTRVPENSVKIMVGVMMTGIGVFWFGEGIGVQWPGADVALFGLYGLTVLATAGAIRVLSVRQLAEVEA